MKIHASTNKAISIFNPRQNQEPFEAIILLEAIQNLPGYRAIYLPLSSLVTSYNSLLTACLLLFTVHHSRSFYRRPSEPSSLHHLHWTQLYHGSNYAGNHIGGI